MEQRVGSVLLRRSRPIDLTPTSSTILHGARQVDRLADHAARELGLGPGGGGVLPIVINADSLSAAPMMEPDRHDVFQRRFIRRVTGATIVPPRHLVPSSHEFALAIELGMG